MAKKQMVCSLRYVPRKDLDADWKSFGAHYEVFLHYVGRPRWEGVFQRWPLKDVRKPPSKRKTELDDYLALARSYPYSVFGDIHLNEAQCPRP